MALFKWHAKNKTNKVVENPDQTAEVDLDLLMSLLSQQAIFYENEPCDSALLCAQLADYLRDINTAPANPTQVQKQIETLNQEEQFRLLLMISAIQQPEFKSTLATTLEPSQTLLDLLSNLAQSLDNLTAELLNQSNLRLEEFARHLCHYFHVAILSETTEESASRLERLDYKLLLAQAEKAKLSAEERMAYLQKLKEEQEESLGQRGKF